MSNKNINIPFAFNRKETKSHGERGDIIGYVGSTGRSQAPHLHYEVFKYDDRINPINFYYGNLTPQEFNALLKKSQQENISLD